MFVEFAVKGCKEIDIGHIDLTGNAESRPE
jgi:hypothetical protein